MSVFGIQLHKVYTSNEEDSTLPVHRMVPRDVQSNEEGEEVVWLEQLDEVFLVNDNSGYAPLPTWAFLNGYTCTGEDAPEAVPHREAVPHQEERIREPKPKRKAKRKTSPVGDGESRIDHNMENLALAFGLSNEWYTEMDARIEDLVENTGKASQVAVALLKDCREEELGVSDLSNFSDYEMKLFYSGFMLAQQLGHIRIQSFTAGAMADITVALIKAMEEEGIEDGADIVLKAMMNMLKDKR